MLATSVDVTSIDTTEATETLSEWLQQAGAAAIIAVVAVLVLNVVIGIAIAKKAGYSGWWGAFATLVPVLGWLLILMFALLKWPALKERDEALTVLRERGIPLPSHERAALKEEERMREVEAQARRDMERAQAQREKAEAERARMRDAGGKADDGAGAGKAETGASSTMTGSATTDSTATAGSSLKTDGGAKSNVPPASGTSTKPGDSTKG